MPFFIVNSSPLVSNTLLLPASDDLDIVELKARTEYERDRQKALKGHDVRKKFTVKKDATSNGLGLKRTGLGHRTPWRNSIITIDDMVDVRDVDTDGELDDGKENSRPSPSVSLEDLIVLRSAPSGPLNAGKKARHSVSRSSLSRKPSSDTLNLESLSLSSPMADLMPIAEQSSPALSPINKPLDFDSVPSLSSSPPHSRDTSLDFSAFSFDSFNELSSPGADDWTMDETEDGCFLFRNKFPSFAEDDAPSSVPTTVLVEKCVW